MKTIEQMVQQEIQCCLSSLISTLARDDARPGTDLAELCDRALGLAMAVPDYEEAAVQAGWKVEGSLFVHHNGQTTAETQPSYPDAWKQLCEEEGLAPYEWEVYEHWAVSQWLAEKLIAQGEKVDTDFAALNVWARQTTGQQISGDGVIMRIYADMMKG